MSKAADAGLFHPSIVEPVAAGIEGTVAYRAEEYVAAESLDVAMRHYAPATVDKVLPFMTQLASAIDFARAAGVGHGALHPRDIFVSPDEARATGFGVVDALERLQLRAPVRRPYSPPERIAGEAWGTPADVFSLGVIAFELLTGRRPSGLGDDMGPLTGATLGDRADKVRAVLARAMLASPLARYETASAFSAALARAAGLEETVVSLAGRLPERPIAPSVEPALQTPPIESVVPALDLAVPSAEQATDDHADRALDDFASEPEVPSPTDSPREAVRKVIAAREARKRQTRKKPADETSAVVPLPSEEGESLPATEGLPIAGVLFETNRVDSPAAPPVVALEPAEPKPAELKAAEMKPAELGEVALQEPATQEAPLEAALAEATLNEVTLKEDALEDATARPRALELEEEDAEVPLIGALDLAPAARDLGDRVVAVDEFRAREAANQKPDRAWPRVAEPSLLDRPERGVAARASAPVAGLGLSPAFTDDSNASDIPPAVLEAAASERQRPVMLERAVILGLGLAVGFALGNFRLNRETPSPLASAPAVSVEGQAGTTGTRAAGARETTVSVPPPANPTAGSNEKTPAVASPPATPAVRTPTAPPAPRARPVTTGRLVVTSNPAKANVTINGKWSGRTPLTLDNLKFGKYEVRVVQTGYEVARERFTLSESAALRTVDVDLRRVPADKRAPAPEARTAASPGATSPSKPGVSATGSIFVDSRPQGARVFIDGKEVGVTPLTLSEQRLGSHSVRLELADHQPVTTTTQIVAQKTAAVTLSLERIK